MVCEEKKTLDTSPVYTVTGVQIIWEDWLRLRKALKPMVVMMLILKEMHTRCYSFLTDRFSNETVTNMGLEV